MIQRTKNELDNLNETARRSMHETKEYAKSIAESRQLLRKVDTVLARDPWVTKQPSEAA